MAEPVLEPNYRPRPGVSSSSSTRRRRRYAYLAVGIGVGTVAGFALALALDIGFRSQQATEPRSVLVGPYHAVRLSSGRLLVGRLDRLAAPFMVVSDAYTVQSDVDAASKEVTWSVVSRGEEGHQPGTVIVGAQHVVSVEAVRPGSRLATMLDEVRAVKR